MATKLKDKFYFSHDSNARRDPKVIALRAKHGFEGYGRFFALIEIMREHEGYNLDISKKYILQSIASELDFKDVDSCNNFIKDCIDFELLESDSIFVWSNSLNARMKLFEEKREYYRNKAKKRWNPEKKKKDDNKDTKKKSEKKKSLFSSVESLRDDKIFGQIKEYVRTKEEFNCVSDTIIEQQRTTIIDWLKSSGKQYKDYKAFFCNCLRRHIRDNGLEGKSSKGKEMIY